MLRARAPLMAENAPSPTGAQNENGMKETSISFGDDMGGNGAMAPSSGGGGAYSSSSGGSRGSGAAAWMTGPREGATPDLQVGPKIGEHCAGAE
jgi:hypothetical protein